MNKAQIAGRAHATKQGSRAQEILKQVCFYLFVISFNIYIYIVSCYDLKTKTKNLLSK